MLIFPLSNFYKQGLWLIFCEINISGDKFALDMTHDFMKFNFQVLHPSFYLYGRQNTSV